MAIYRYSPTGVETLLRRADLTLAALPIVVTLFSGVALFWNRASSSITSYLPLALAGPFLIWLSFRQRPKIRSLIESTEIELTGSQLIARNAQTTVAIRQDEARELRLTKQGLQVLGKNAGQTMELKNELEDFTELARAVETWAPVSVKRSTGSAASQWWVLSIVVLNLVLLSVAFGSREPLVAVPSCVSEAVILTGALIWIWRHRKTVPPKLLWSSLVAILPILSLLWRAYLMVYEPDRFD